MTKFQTTDSIKIYCNSTLKKQIKNVANLENTSISKTVTNILDSHFSTNRPTIDESNISKELSQLKLLTTMCFKDLFYALGKAEAFEDICKHVYTDKKGGEIHE